MLSNPVPLVNIANMCQKNGTHWLACAKMCAKFDQFQIYSYTTKLNGNNLFCVYNINNFKLFSIVSV